MPTILDAYGRPATQPISPEDVQRTFDASKRKIEENTRSLIEGMEKAEKAFTKMIEKTGDIVDRQLEESEMQFRRMADLFGRGLADVLSRSLKRSIPSSIGELAPGFGKSGEQFGEMAGKSIALAFTANPVVALIGGTMGKMLANELSMQFEGFRMLGARAAPVATGGLRTDVDFEKIAIGYTVAIKNVSVATGASADEVGALAEKLSRVGYGFLDGAEKEVTFALAAERVMNLSRGTVEALQTDTVTRYGDSLASARRQVNSIRDAQREFIAINWQTNSSITRTLSAGQTLTDLLGQISSAARNSGASLREMNNLAAGLVKTMAAGSAGQMFRPGQMAEVGANLMQNILPSMSATMNEEAQKSKIDYMLMNQTAYGRQVAKTIQGMAPPSLRGSGQNFLFNMMQQNYALGGRGQATQIALGKLAGIHDTINKFGLEKGMAFLEQRGFNPSATYAANQIMEELLQRGFNPQDPRNQERIFKDYLKEAQRDPRAQARLQQAGLTEDMLDVAKKQGGAMQSSLDHLANVMVDFRAGLQGYLDTYKDTTAEAFGLDKNSSWWSLLGESYKMIGRAVVAPNAKNLAALYKPVWESADDYKNRMSAYDQPNVQSETTVMTRDAAKASAWELNTRDKNVASE